MAQNWFVMQPLNSVYPVQLPQIQAQGGNPYNSPLLWPMGGSIQPVYLTMQPSSMEGMMGLTQDPTVRLQRMYLC